MTYEYKGVRPTCDPESFIADGARVIGRVTLGKYSSVWFNAVLRGDVNAISLGAYSNVQDNAVVHVADHLEAVIGDFVTIGHSAVVHGCTIEDHCLIGMSATILNGAVIGRGSIIAAGAVVRENDIIPPHSLVVGVPAKVVRQVPDHMDMIHAQAVKYKTHWTVNYGFLKDAGGEIYKGEKIL
jgi:carbonic anhydrase/acetyltransferase-like protein (isoleucine patch superfamily)